MVRQAHPDLSGFDKLTTNGRGKGAVVNAVGDFPKDLLLEMKGKNGKRNDPVILASMALAIGIDTE